MTSDLDPGPFILSLIPYTTAFYCVVNLTPFPGVFMK